MVFSLVRDYKKFNCDVMLKTPSVPSTIIVIRRDNSGFIVVGCVRKIQYSLAAGEARAVFASLLSTFEEGFSFILR